MIVLAAAQFLIWFGATMTIFGLAGMLLAIAVQEMDHTPYFFGVSKALRAVFPVYVHHEPDEFVQIVSDLDAADDRR